MCYSFYTAMGRKIPWKQKSTDGFLFEYIHHRVMLKQDIVSLLALASTFKMFSATYFAHLLDGTYDPKTWISRSSQ